MTTRYAFDAVDRTFRDIIKSSSLIAEGDKPFGGKTVILGGNFRQILPVVPKGNREHIVVASLHKSTLWNHCELRLLHQNMRLESFAAEPNLHLKIKAFAQWVLDIGDGNVESISLPGYPDSTWIKIPEDMLIDERLGLKGLIDSTYPDLESSYTDFEYLQGRAILAPRNKDVDQINAEIISMLPGDQHTYYSADTKIVPEQTSKTFPLDCPTEFLNSLTSSNLPNHQITLKIGSPIILLRNLNQSIGLCNGTRLTVTRLGSKVISCRILTGCEAGRIVTIPRVKLFSDNDEYPFVLQRI